MPVKGCKIQAFARRFQLLSREGSLSCPTCCETGRFIQRSAPCRRLLWRARCIVGLYLLGFWWQPFMTKLCHVIKIYTKMSADIKDPPPKKQKKKKRKPKTTPPPQPPTTKKHFTTLQLYVWRRRRIFVNKVYYTAFSWSNCKHGKGDHCCVINVHYYFLLS